MYMDSFDAYRSGAVTESGRLVQREKVIFKDEKCLVTKIRRLFGQSEAPDVLESYGSTKFVLTMFHSKKIVLEDGDRVVCKKEGHEYEGVSGGSFVYPTHAETQVLIYRIA